VHALSQGDPNAFKDINLRWQNRLINFVTEQLVIAAALKNSRKKIPVELYRCIERYHERDTLLSLLLLTHLSQFQSAKRLLNAALAQPLATQESEASHSHCMLQIVLK